MPAGARARLGAGLCVVGPFGGFGAHLLPPNFRTFLAGGYATGPRLYDAVTGQATDVPGFAAGDPRGRAGLPGFAGRLTIKAVSADGKRAVIERTQGAHVVFEIATGKEVGTVPNDRGTAFVALSADGKVLATEAPGADGTHDVIVWNVDGNVQLARFKGLKSPYLRMFLAPDGNTLVTISAGPQDPTVVQLWSVVTGNRIAALPGDYTGGPAVFSPDGKTLATADAVNGAVQLWDAATGKPGALLLGRSATLGPLAFSPDGKTLAALARDWTVLRWALPDGKQLKATPFPVADLLPYPAAPGTLGLAFADNDRAVAWGEVGAVALLWDAPSGKLLTPITGHLGAVGTVRFTADGKEILTAGADRQVIRWDAATGRRAEVVTDPPRQRPFDMSGQFPYRHLSPDGARGLRHQSLFRVAEGEELFSLPVRDATPSDDFRRAAGFGRTWAANRPSTYDVWDLVTRRRVAQLEAPAAIQRPNDGAIAFSPDASRLVAAVPVSEPGRAQWPVLVIGWDLGTGKRLGEVRVPAQSIGFGDTARPHLAPAGDNARVVLATADGKLWAADYTRGAGAEAVTELAQSQQRFTHPTFSPDGKTFAVAVPAGGSDGHEVQVYDWPRGQRLHTFTGHRWPVTALAFAPDGKTLASGSADGSVLLWDTAAVPAPK
ncbi:WD40 repeat domain-containing protein [Frigoriglobus tundricola]|uniref:Anaphase-promoting complex subunit 4 WD40 domain-containing protein n=1 Tax=Frigoriglobus tundricola TaxID=2774151 RepID=A0A6M5YL00_9BACT|nr:PD40 domain-containing protein [Frigoriglobus tundricola]QJW94769.1 hypothetical protein FTUN_2292 [Frigoriglobus tundricola]